MISHSYKLNTGMKCVKYMLLIINFMFMLTASLLILVATTIQAIYGDFKEFIDDHFLSPPTLLVAIGCIMLLVSSFGCFGAIKESTMLINIYGVFLFFIFILEISLSIAAFVIQGQTQTILLRTMNGTFIKYGKNEYARKSVDFIQSELHCCGIYDKNDWYNKFSVNQNHTRIQNETLLPLSCCSRFGINVYDDTECFDYYNTGCLEQLTRIISSNALVIETGAMTVAFVQLLGAFCAFMLAKTIRRNKSLREAKRWQLQQSLGVLSTGNDKIFQEFSGYTQLSRSEIEKCAEPVTYTASSPSIN